MTEGWNRYKNKKVYIKTKEGRAYTGVVTLVDTDIPIFLTILDKFNKFVTFSVTEIAVIQEEE